MTKTLALLLTAVLVAAGLQLPATDARVVTGVRVDLTPIEALKSTKTGPRPMPHWSDLTIVEHRGLFGPGHRVVLQVDGVGQREVVLQFRPQEFLDLLAAERTARNQAAYAQQVAEAAKQAERASDAETTRRLSSDYATASFAYALNSRSAAANTRPDAPAAANQHAATASALQSLRMSHRDLPMFTGRSAGTLQISTFGKKDR